MKPLLLLVMAASTLLAITAGTARADPATHSTFSFSGQTLNPAGTVCDFNEKETFNVRGIVNTTPEGNLGTFSVTLSLTHTNLDTGFTLSEVDHETAIIQLVRGTVINVGI